MALDPAQFDPATIFVPDGSGSWLVVAPLALCLVSGALLVTLRSQPRLQPVIAGLSLLLLLLLDLMLLAAVHVQGPMTMVMGRWLPPFGIAFTVDMTGALLNAMAAFIALPVFLQSLTDIDPNGRRHGFYPLLMLLMAGASGAFLTGDVFNLYVWFEVLLISSFGLMVLGGERRQIDGAIKYGLLNLIATTLFLVATGLVYSVFGTLNMADLARKFASSRPDGAPLVAIAALYLMAFGMKAAAFPLNFWLPASYHTPRIAVSALFAGLLTKVGIYALLRVLVMIMPGERLILADAISVIAILTMVIAALSALGQQDIRRMAGHVVIAGIGLMLAGLALATPASLAAILFYAIHSMAAMAGLYLAIGLIGQSGRSFSLSALGGQWLVNPGLSALVVLLVLAASGLPPLSGFWPKAILVREALAAGRPWLAGGILLSAFLVTLTMARLILLALWRPAEADSPKAVPKTHLSPVWLAVLPLLVFGLWPAPLHEAARTGATGLTDVAAYLASVFPGGLP